MDVYVTCTKKYLLVIQKSIVLKDKNFNKKITKNVEWNTALRQKCLIKKMHSFNFACITSIYFTQSQNVI